MITNEQLEIIKSDLLIISPFPWKYTETKYGEYWIMSPDDSDHEYRSDYEPIFESSGTISQLGIDAEFIANAPDLIKSLVDEIKRLTRLLKS